jgi:hypothetical protein
MSDNNKTTTAPTLVPKVRKTTLTSRLAALVIPQPHTYLEKGSSTYGGPNAILMIDYDESSYMKAHDPLIRQPTVRRGMAAVALMYKAWQKMPLATKYLLLLIFMFLSIVVLTAFLTLVFQGRSSMAQLGRIVTIVLVLIATSSFWIGFQV